MRRLRSAVILLLLIPMDVAAQERPATGWTAVPSVGFGWLGRRWSGGTDGNTVTLGPGPFAQFAVGVGYRTAGRTTYEFQAALTPTEFGADIETDSVPSRAAGVGRVNVVRAQAGILHRLRPTVPGYFSAGAGMIYLHVVRPFANWEQENELAPSAHVGAGYDASSGTSTIRLDARLHLTRGMNTVFAPIGPLEPRFAADFIFSVGYLIGL